MLDKICEIQIKDERIEFYSVEFGPISIIANVPKNLESSQLYFRVCNGPFLWPEQEDDKLVWKLPQHERRLWQSGESVVFGYFDDPKTEFELDLDQRQTIQKYFV